MTNDDGKSDSSVVPGKPPNKAGKPAAEVVEGRGLAKGNPHESNTHRTQSRASVPSALERIRQAARKDRKQRFTSLLHHVYDVERLRAAYLAIKRDAAAGIDGETWRHYGENLVQRANRPLYRAYLLKESLAGILGRHQLHVARTKLCEWIAWAARSRLAPFKKLSKTIRRHLDGILGHIATGLSNGPLEGLNGKIRTITRRAYGFHHARNLISFIFLCCTGLVLRPVFKKPVPHPLEC